MCRKATAKGRKSLNRIQAWALQLEARIGHNKDTVALANKLTRIAWAVWKNETQFKPDFLAS